jgi:hypothetical protein
MRKLAMTQRGGGRWDQNWRSRPGITEGLFGKTESNKFDS